MRYAGERFSGAVTWQANEYVKFNFGLGYSHDQGHNIGGDPPCNPIKKFSDNGQNLQVGGPCHSGGADSPRSTGVANPNYRQSINAVGRRFFVDDSNTFDLQASGVVMF